MNIKIKKIENGEAGLVVELFNKYRVFYKQDSDLNLAKAFIQDRLKSNESIIFVAFSIVNKKLLPIGFAQLYPSYSSVRAIKYWTLNDLYVEQEFRKCGVGTLLIETIIEFARKENAAKIELSTGINNTTAQRLYNKIGFVRQQADNEYCNYTLELK